MFLSWKIIFILQDLLNYEIDSDEEWEEEEPGESLSGPEVNHTFYLKS